MFRNTHRFIFTNGCFFSVISYDDLILNIPYIKTIENFNSFPEFKFPTKEEILENAREALDYKQKTELNNKLIDENISLKKKIGKLKQRIQISNLDYEDLNEKIHAMKRNFISLVHTNQQIGQNNFQVNQNKFFEENYVISKEEITKYPIFESMVNRFISNKPDQYFLKFCSLMRILNSKSYDYLYEMLPLYSVTSCKYFVRINRNDSKS